MINITGLELIEKFETLGFNYNKDLLLNYYNSLSTKPFVILTGISGSGKSKIAEIFAEALSQEDVKSYELVPVKPNWRDSKGLFGYHNLIDGSYYITPTIKLFIKALNDNENPYFLILDEMNLAKTEHYFSDYLSLIESRRNINIDLKIIEKLTKSECIILSALNINKHNEYLDVDEYRNDMFSQMKRKFSDNGKSWDIAYRSELNQGENRLANRVFESPDGDGFTYKLKAIGSLTPDDKKKINKIKNIYNNLIKQDNIILHNAKVCLSSESGEECTEACEYKDSNKFRCPLIYNKDTEKYLIPPQIPIPLNLFTIGTVNVDETTYMFSPKVLDRSNVIEFNSVDFSNIYNLGENEKEILSNSNKNFSDNEFYFNNDLSIPKLEISISNIANVKQFSNFAKPEFLDLLKIFTILEKYNMHFGYRVMNEISLYLCNIHKNIEYTEKYKIALDLQILQKILPKMYGQYEKLWVPLTSILNQCLKTQTQWKKDISIEELIKYLDSKTLNLNEKQLISLFKYPRSANKILTMLNDLNSIGFATFIK